MTAGLGGSALVRIWAVLTELHRIATGQELTIEQARIYFLDPSAIARLLESNGSGEESQRLKAIARLWDELQQCGRGPDIQRGSDGI
jgi:hypothetical protein